MCPSFHAKKPALFIASLLIAGSAQATTVTECLADVEALRSTIIGADFVNQKDETGLVGKSDSTSQKINRGKFADASSILAAMRDQVASLVGAAKPKLGAADGAAITGKIDTTSTCVVQIVTQP